MWYYRYKSFIISLLFLLLFNSHANAQVKITLTDDSSYLLIGKSMYYIKDTGRQINFNDILSHKYDDCFKLYNQDVPNFGNVELTTWNRFTVVNKSSSQWYLLVDNYNIDTLHFYYKDSTGNYRHIRSGRSLPISARQYRTNGFVFDMPVLKGDSAVFYLQVQSYFMQYPLKIMSRQKFIETTHHKDLLEGLYYGFLLFIVLYNFFLYFSAKDKNYLYYIVYVIFNGLMVAQLKGFVAELWGDDFHFMWKYAPVVVGISASTTFVFTNYVLETKKNTPILNRIITYIFLPLYLIIVSLSLLGQNLYASLLNQVVGIAGLLVMYATAIVVYRKGYKYAGFYIAACWSYFAGVVVYVLKAFTILPFTSFTDNAIEIGSTVQLIMFSFTLAAKVRAYKREQATAQEQLVHSLKENERLITEQNKVLEIKVDERTKELQHTLQALELSQQELQQKNVVITKEKERSDHLLLNILPYETAQELKENGSAAARFYENVTVMFTDFKNFTHITESMEPAELVAELDYCFKAFDSIIDKYDIEKIKTIGDSYMAATGLPMPDKNGATKMVKAAIELQSFMKQHNLKRINKNKPPFEIRIGVHTGSVIAGIVGNKKFAYDIWGDTVNTASRMESSGTPGKINISEATYSCIKSQFNCTYRGKISAKSKGEIDMYFVESMVV